ncbi:phage tail length tape measure family protein [Novosphingobium sp. BL-8H]|uniref:phage tail length tape measure family protein n=1 Tax=Novosphingobium sp. BL-8H TaxID=3127640 RepID=UPI003757F39E
MDVAALQLSVDSSDVVKAANDLDKFTASAKRAGAAASLQTGSIAKLVASVQSMDSKLSTIIGSLDKISTAMSAMGRASQVAATGQDNVAQAAQSAAKSFANADAHVNSYRDHLQGLVAQQNNVSRAMAAADAHVTAYAQHLRQASNTPSLPSPIQPSSASSGSFTSYGAAAIKETGQAAQLAAHHAQNLFYQLNDVFVSVASGQKPLTVFIQQGSQIAQIYAQAGMGLKGFSLGLANMLGLLSTTTAETEALALAEAQQSAASVAAANAQATANVRAAETNIAIAEAQVALAATATEAATAQARLTLATESLAVAQTEATITAAALDAAMVAEGEAATAAAAATTVALTPLAIILAGVVAVLALFTAGVAALNKQANDDSGLKKYTTAMGYTKAEVEKLNAVTVTWGDTAKAVFQVGWQRIAEAFGLTTDDLSKAWSSFTDWMVTATRAALGGVYAAFTGAQNIIPRILDNIKTGKKEGLLEIIGGSFSDQYKEAQKFMDDVVGQSRKNARARQDAMATKFYDAPTERKGRHEYDFSDLLKDADKQRNDLTKASAQIGVYGEALAQVTYEQDLLNKASEHGLKLTPQQTAQINEISKALAALSEQNRHDTFMENFNEQTNQQIASLEQARGAIGLTGAALASYTYEQEQLNKALAEHITLTDADRQKISDDAVKVGDAAYQNIREKSASDNARSHAEAMRQLEVERDAIGLTGQALIAYNYQQDLINKALQEGVSFKDIDIEKTRRQAEAYAEVRYSIDQQKQSIADAREVTKGFFEDWINGVREGGNLFKSFADAVINSLNRIIDKMLDRMLNTLLDSLFTGGTGSLFANGGSFGSAQKYALGGSFGTPTRFANGGAFTNTVVSTPTLFRFANGGALGEMGEAGPEAIMPLSRDSSGKLGVRASGGGSRNASVKINTPIVIQQSGSFTTEDARAMAAQAGAAAVQEVRRNLDAYLREWEIDGAVSS